MYETPAYKYAPDEMTSEKASYLTNNFNFTKKNFTKISYFRIFRFSGI